MRTNIEVDDKLMAAVMKQTGLPTKRAAVEEALQPLLQVRRQGRIRELFGKVAREGDLDESRRA